MKCPTFSYKALQRARGALCAALSYPSLQDAPCLICHLVSFPFGKLGEKVVKVELICFRAHLLAAMVRIGLIGKVPIKLVTTVCMGFAEFLMQELQSWSKIFVVGEYHCFMSVLCI